MLARTIETTVGPHTVRAPDGTLCAGFGSLSVVVAPSVALAVPDPGCLLRASVRRTLRRRSATLRRFAASSKCRALVKTRRGLDQDLLTCSSHKQREFPKPPF